MSEAKHKTIRAALETAIVSGEYLAGDQLPAEQDIAQRYKVSVITARRAVSDLVAADLLERRARLGTFVRHRTRDRLSKVTVNLITTLYDSPLHNKIINHCLYAFDQQGWHTNVVQLAGDQQDSAVRLIENGGYAVLLLDNIREGSALGRAVRTATDRVVSLFPNLSPMGVPTVMTSQYDNIRMAQQRLNEAGHTNIAIAAQFPHAVNDTENIIAWQRTFMNTYRSLESDLRLIRISAPLGKSPTEKAYEATRDFFEANPDVTATIAMGDEITVGMLAAFRDIGRPCPEKMSLICLYDSEMMRFFMPPVTCIDGNYATQVDVAIEILNANIKGKYTGDILRMTPAQLVERSSVHSINDDASRGQQNELVASVPVPHERKQQ